MKKFAHALLAAVAGLALTSAHAAELRLGDWQSTTHIVSKEGTQKWMADVTEMTDGEVTFQHFPAEQAAKSKELLNAVRNGIIDVGLIGPIYHAEELPLNSVVGLPGFYTSAVEGTEALQAMIKDGPLREELLSAGVVPIFAFVLPPYQILSTDSRLGKPSDWNGLNIRTSGATQAMIARDLGAAGVSISGPEVYSAVETGRLDGILFPLASVPGYNLHEVVKHISTNGSFGGYSFVVIANESTYEGLSQEARDAMLKAGAEAAAHVAEAQDNSVSELTEEWAASGIDVYTFTDEERTTINEAISGAQEEWLERIGKRNPKAADVVAQYKELTSQ